MRSRWQTERDKMQEIKSLSEQIERIKSEAAVAERAGDLNRAAELTYGTLRDLESNREQARDELKAAMATGESFLREDVTAQDIAGIVSKWTGSPGRQDARVRAAKAAVDGGQPASARGWPTRSGRIGCRPRFGRLGRVSPTPTGRSRRFCSSGPRESARPSWPRHLAEFLFDDERQVVRIDMSEYMEKFSVSRLLGAPPGYVGYDEGGQLTEAVRRKPYSVVLLDEIEKAHPDVFNVLLQLLDDGRLTDSQGRTVDFRNTIIIMTSNIGSELMLQDMDETERQRLRQQALRRHFRPEFVNRVDGVISFHPLGREQMRGILDIQLRGLDPRLADRDLTLEVTDAAKDALAARGYDPEFGARPLKRLIARAIVDPLAQAILEGRFGPGTNVVADLAGDDDETQMPELVLRQG